jgi:hypothetical protein
MVHTREVAKRLMARKGVKNIQKLTRRDRYKIDIDVYKT